MAQTSTCLQPRIFKRTLAIVRGVLDDARSETKQKLSYKRLLNDFRMPDEDFMLTSMQEVEKGLKASKELRGELASAHDGITLAVFLWTCRTLGVCT